MFTKKSNTLIKLYIFKDYIKINQVLDKKKVLFKGIVIKTVVFVLKHLK